MNKKLLLVDGNSLTYRAFYGSAYGPKGILTTSDGIPVNAVLTLNSMLNKAIKKYEPTHMLVAFDAGKKTIRHDKLESYKGGRKATPEELIKQFPIVKEMLDKWGIKHFEKSGIEADDIIGTLATKYCKESNVLVMSSDKDLYQLVQEGVTVIVPQNGIKENKVISIDDFFDIHGYNPNQVIDMKGLVGDPSDNLPGVVGIGEKGALKLLQAHQTLEGVYENINEQTASVQAKLEKCKDMAFLCKEIATLMLDINVDFTFDDLEFNNIISFELIEFFEKYELNSLVKRFSVEKKIDSRDESEQITFDNLII